MNDFWSSDKFEDIVTKGTIALFETEIDPRDCGKHWSKITKSDLAAIRSRGVFIPAPDRLFMTEVDPLCKLPVVGSVAMACDDLPRNEQDDSIPSYFQITQFRRVAKTPKGVHTPCKGPIYEELFLFPQDSGPMRVGKCYNILSRNGRFVNCQNVYSALERNEQIRLANGMALNMFAVQDMRNQWVISAHTEETKVSLGAYPDAVKSILYARSLPLTASGRKRPILHLVRAHKRRIKEGIDINIRQFLRGVHEVQMDGIKYSVSASAKLQEDLIRKEQK